MIDTITIEAPATRMPRLQDFRVYNIQSDGIRSHTGVLGRGRSGPIRGTYARRYFRNEDNKIVYTCLVIPGGRLPRIRISIPSLPKLRYGHNLWGPSTPEEFVNILNELQYDLALQGIRVDLMASSVQRFDVCTTLEFCNPIRGIVSFLHSAIMGSVNLIQRGFETGIGLYSNRIRLQAYDAVARLGNEIEKFPSLRRRNLLRIECQFRNLIQRKAMQHFNTITGLINNYSSLRELLIGKFFSALLPGFERLRFQAGHSHSEVQAFKDSNLAQLAHTPIKLLRSMALETFLECDHSGYYVRGALTSTLQAHGLGTRRMEGYYRTLRWLVLFRALNRSIQSPDPSEGAQEILNEIIQVACAFSSNQPSTTATAESDSVPAAAAGSNIETLEELIQTER